MFDRYQQGHVLPQAVPPKTVFRQSPDGDVASGADHQQPVISQPSPIRGAAFGQLDIQPPLRTRSTPPTADTFQQPRFTPHKSNGPSMGPMTSAYTGLPRNQSHGYPPAYPMPDIYTGYAMGHDGYLHNTYLQQQQAQRMPIHQPVKRASKALQIVDPATGKPIVLDEPQAQKHEPAHRVAPKISRPSRIQSSPINSALVLSCANSNIGYSKTPMTPIQSSPDSAPHSIASSELPMQGHASVSIDFGSDDSSFKQISDHQKAKDVLKSLKKIDIPNEAVQVQNATPIDSSSVKASSKHVPGRRILKEQTKQRATTPVSSSTIMKPSNHPPQETENSFPTPITIGKHGVENETIDLSVKPHNQESPSEKSKHPSILVTSPRQLPSPDSDSVKSSLPPSSRGHSPTPSEDSNKPAPLDDIPEISLVSKSEQISPKRSLGSPKKSRVGSVGRPVERPLILKPTIPESEAFDTYSAHFNEDFKTEASAQPRLSLNKSDSQSSFEMANELLRRYTVEEILSLQSAFNELPEDIVADSPCLKLNAIPSSDRSAFSYARGSDPSHRVSRSGSSMHRKSSHNDSQNTNGNRRLSFRDDGERHHERQRHSRRISHKSAAKDLVRHEEPAVEPLKKSETRWVPRQKVTDDEEILRRKIKAVLNKLTLEKFDSLSAQFLNLVQEKVSSVDHLRIVVELIFDKALSEPTFVKMYSSLCVAIAESMPEFNSDADNGSSSEDPRSQTFKRLLLNQCQQEFERGTSFKVDPSLNEEERERSFRLQKNRFLGNVRFIGELFKDSMLAERIMHTCIYHFLQEAMQPMEEDIEALCKLLATIGKRFDRPQAKSHIDSYFNRMRMMSTNPALSRRARFMLMDAIDLRKSGWRPRRKEVEAKTIDEFRQEMEREAAEHHSRSSKTGSRFDSFSGRGPSSRSSHQGW